jgi:hypothetical protein
MWLISTYGFFSAVVHREHEENVLVRSSAREDLENLCELAKGWVREPDLEDFSEDLIIEISNADYRYRLIASADGWREIATAMCDEMNYQNFKSAVAAQDPERGHIYMDVWRDLLEIQRD